MQAPPRSPGRSAANARRVERVHRGAENRILGIGTGTELRRVRLSDNDGAGLPQCRNNTLVFRGYVIRMERRAKGCQDTLGHIQVLHSHRQTMQGAKIIAAHNRIFRRLSFGPCAIEASCDHRVDGPIHGFDARNTRIRQLNGGQGLSADKTARVDSAQVAEFGHGGIPLSLIINCFQSSVTRIFSISGIGRAISGLPSKTRSKARATPKVYESPCIGPQICRPNGIPV